MSLPPWQTQALAILAACATVHDSGVQDLIASFQLLLTSCGFDAAAAGGWTGIGDGRTYRFYFNTWPADWLDIYRAENLFQHDPIVLEAMRRMVPFRWADLTADRTLGDQAMGVIARARAYGWADGLAVPIHGPSGYQGIVSLAARQPLELSPDQVSLIWVLSMALHARCRVARGIGESSGPVPYVSPRERECMRWVAAGKTDWEIGALMSISPSTAHFHIERVKKRLCIGSRTAAVALLVLYGAI